MISGDRPSSPQYPEDAAQGLAGLTALARDRLPSAEGPHAVREAYARFRVASGERTESRRRTRAIWAVSTGALALAAVGALLLPILRRPAPPALSLRVEGGAVAEGGYVRAVASDGEPRLRFSDGTEVTLERATRARVAETDEHGARVLLEEGRARAHVVSRPRSRWIFDAGPCRVWVTGTRFDLRWSAARQVLEVALFHGNVTVEGPPAVAGVPMRAGQRLVMDVKAGTVRFGEIGVGETEEGAGVSTGASGSTGASATTAATATASPSVEAREAPEEASVPEEGTRRAAGRAEGWQARVLAGEFRGVIREARRRGIDEVMRRESAANLMALADAARYAGGSGLATRALTQVRG